MSDSNFDFKPDSETENQYSDGSVFTGQQKSAHCFNIPVSLSPSPLFLLLSFPALMFKFKPRWHLLSTTVPTERYKGQPPTQGES